MSGVAVKIQCYFIRHSLNSQSVFSRLLNCCNVFDIFLFSFQRCFRIEGDGSWLTAAVSPLYFILPSSAVHVIFRFDYRIKSVER